MNAYYLHTENMTVGYDGKPLIEHIEIGVRRGEILTLIGPNGSGKSTILKSMIRQLKLIAGTVVLDGQAMAGMKEGDIAQRLSIVMTERIKAELMSCYDLVATGRYPYTGRLGLLSEEDHRIVREAIRTVHAEEFADRPFTEISDGQRQRLLLARAICQEPEVIVLDEPTSFLDIRHKLELLDILKNLVREKNVAVILSLHELDLAQKVSDRVVCVANERIDRCDTPENIFTDEYIARLYGIEKGSYNALLTTRWPRPWRRSLFRCRPSRPWTWRPWTGPGRSWPAASRWSAASTPSANRTRGTGACGTRPRCEGRS